MEKFNYKKKYGQNFLINDEVLNKISNSINATDKDLIIEIGPGMGALTKKLIEKNTNLICFEIDLDTKKHLDKIVNNKTKIIYEDILTVDLKGIISKEEFEKLYIVGNLPYYITTKIITTILELDLNPQEMVFMVQKEVADRFTAKPGTKQYGYITVLLDYYYESQVIINAPKEYFNPMPKVDSKVVKFVKKDKISVENFEDFNRFIKECFKFKRKKLLNNLDKYDKEKVVNYLKDNNLSLNIRAEELNLKEFIDLYNSL